MICPCCRVLTVVVVAFLAAGCNSHRDQAPVDPTPPPASGPAGVTPGGGGMTEGPPAPAVSP